MLPTPVFLGFLCGSAYEESACNKGDLGSIPGLGRSPGEGKGYPLTPVFWPGEFRGLYSPWSCRESGTTERLSLSQSTGGLPGGTSGKELACQCRRPWFNSWVGNICWRRDKLPTPVFLGFPGGSAGKESTHNVGDPGLIPGLEDSPEKGTAIPLQYSGLENFVDFTVHGVAKSRTRLSDFTHLQGKIRVWFLARQYLYYKNK